MNNKQKLNKINYSINELKDIFDDDQLFKTKQKQEEEINNVKNKYEEYLKQKGENTSDLIENTNINTNKTESNFENKQILHNYASDSFYIETLLQIVNDQRLHIEELTKNKNKKDNNQNDNINQIKQGSSESNTIIFNSKGEAPATLENKNKVKKCLCDLSSEEQFQISYYKQKINNLESKVTSLEDKLDKVKKAYTENLPFEHVVSTSNLKLNQEVDQILKEKQNKFAKFFKNNKKQITKSNSNKNVSNYTSVKEDKIINNKPDDGVNNKMNLNSFSNDLNLDNFDFFKFNKNLNSEIPQLSSLMFSGNNYSSNNLVKNDSVLRMSTTNDQKYFLKNDDIENQFNISNGLTFKAKKEDKHIKDIIVTPIQVNKLINNNDTQDIAILKNRKLTPLKK